jgi:hypothetical protein
MWASNYNVHMKTIPDNLKSKVQETLNEVFSEGKLPFHLTAYTLQTDDAGRYVVSFYDTRIHSMTFSVGDRSLKDTVRAAVLDRIKNMSGPLAGWGNLLRTSESALKTAIPTIQNI